MQQLGNHDAPEDQRPVQLDHAGIVALVGRPNVGKSSLLNRLVGCPLSIVTPKVQTTRRRLAGIVERPAVQWVLTDTPGLLPAATNALERQMMRTAQAALAEGDLVLLVVEAGRWTTGDERAARLARAARKPLHVAVNKIDRLADKRRLLPFIAAHIAPLQAAAVYPVSAQNGDGIAALEAGLSAALPPGPALFPPGQIADRNEQFIAAEAVREALMLRLHQEVPYRLTVTIERWRETPGLIHIDAAIFVAKESQKGIVIGRGGEVLKQVGSRARVKLEKLLGRQVMLRLWVRVRRDWIDDAKAVTELGAGD